MNRQYTLHDDTALLLYNTAMTTAAYILNNPNGDHEYAKELSAAAGVLRGQHPGLDYE